MPHPPSKATKADAERVAAQRARWLERKTRKRQRQATEPILLSRGEWGGLRSTSTRVKVVRS
jgi:hypothetical protein